MERSLVLLCTSIGQPQAGPREGPPEPGTVALHFATLDALRPRLSDLSGMLDDHERDRAARFVHDPDRERYVLGHGFLRAVLGKATGRTPASITFQRGEFGKPVMGGNDVHFNFSDTKDAVIIGIANSELGVDIETMSRRVDHLSVAEHYFTPEEIAVIASSADGKRQFLDFWTRKEAVLKASGVGIMDDLKILRVDAPRIEVRIAHGDFVRMAAPEYHVRSFAIGEAHRVSVASSEPLDPRFAEY